jgi:phosphoglycolate phosphatase-like HAD superfamily hydrolase
MIVLFDIDGTLVSTGGAGRDAYEAAFADEFGEDHGLLEFSFSGMTDPLIIRRGLDAAGREVTSGLVDAIVERYVENLGQAIEASTGYTVYPGVDELVSTLLARDGVAVGLGTGNIERGARMKLRPAGLSEHFAFGGFGSDATERADLLRAGAGRGAERLGRPLEQTRVVVIGDTPRDVRAAHKIGAECLAVDTGSTDTDAIRESDPDLLVPDLRAPALREALGLE